MHKLLTTAAVGLSLALTPYAASAGSIEQLEAQIKQMQEEIALLKRQREVEKEVAVAKSEKQANVELGAKGLSVTSADKRYGLKLRGYAQVDGRVFFNDDANTGKDEILARRIRPILEANVDDLSLRFMPDFAGSSTRVYDLHADYRFNDAVKVRVGKFKPPVGLERLQSASDMAFIERGQPTNLVPNRDFGVQLYGELIPQTLEYQIGVFNGTPDLGNLDSDDDDKKDVALRVFAHPFRTGDSLALQGLGLGVGGTYGARDGSTKTAILPQYKTPGQQTFFAYRTGTAASDIAYADGVQWRVAPQAYWYYNSLGILGEYTVSSQEVTRGAVERRLQQQAWQAQVSYVLTGEDASYQGVKPARPFNPSEGAWGAFELVGRVGATDVDDDAFPIFADIAKSASKAQSYGAGINWFLNDSVSLWLDYEFTQFDGGAAAGADRPDEQALLSRVQYKF